MGFIKLGLLAATPGLGTSVLRRAGYDIQPAILSALPKGSGAQTWVATYLNFNNKILDTGESWFKNGGPPPTNPSTPPVNPPVNPPSNEK